MPSCSVPSYDTSYGGPCRTPVPNCLNQQATPELASHNTGTTPTASEDAFVNRYALPSVSHTRVSTANAVGGRRRRRRRRQRCRTHHRKRSKRSTSRRTTPTRTQRAGGRKRVTKRHGGVGYRFDLSTCPPGGLPDTTQYSTNVCDFY